MNISEVNSNRDLNPNSIMIKNDYSQIYSYSTDRKPLKAQKKKSARSRSKIAALISKEYKEDLIDNQEFIKAKLGHSNSFEGKIKNFNTIGVSTNLSRKILSIKLV